MIILFIIEGYKTRSRDTFLTNLSFFITQAKDCESGYNSITNSEIAHFDIAFLDISMPLMKKKHVFWEDLAKLILEFMPNCKIILLTMFTEFLKIKPLSIL
jgi:two-component SAPR family response regulator